MSPEFAHQIFALPPDQRYELAQQLLDSIDDKDASMLEQQFYDDLKRRREEMLRGEQVVADWRAALAAIEQTLPLENRG